jgi:hypothetical protein
MLRYGSEASRWYTRIFGVTFTGFSSMALVAFIVGAHIIGVFIALLLVATGAWVTWMGVVWLQERSRDRVGGGPLCTERLGPDEELLLAADGAYSEPGDQQGWLGRLTGSGLGRVYLTDRRLIACPSRLMLFGRPVSLPYSLIESVSPGASWSTLFGRSGARLGLRGGSVATLWTDDSEFLRLLPEVVASPPSGEPSPVALMATVHVALLLGGALLIAWVLGCATFAYWTGAWPVALFFAAAGALGVINLVRAAMKYFAEKRTSPDASG